MRHEQKNRLKVVYYFLHPLPIYLFRQWYDLLPFDLTKESLILIIACIKKNISFWKNLRTFTTFYILKKYFDIFQYVSTSNRMILRAIWEKWGLFSQNCSKKIMWFHWLIAGIHLSVLLNDNIHWSFLFQHYYFFDKNNFCKP